MTLHRLVKIFDYCCFSTIHEIFHTLCRLVDKMKNKDDLLTQACDNCIL